MNERALPVLEQYDCKIKGNRRVRGSYYCETDKGLFLLNEYESSREKLEIVVKLQEYLEEKGFKTDRVCRNKEGELMSIGPDGGQYILKKWYEHKECDPENEEDIVCAVRTMADFHLKCNKMDEVFVPKVQDETESAMIMGNPAEIPLGKNLKDNMAKHNRELHKAKRYLERLKNKSDFDMQLKNQMEKYCVQAEAAFHELDEDLYNRQWNMCIEDKTLCHGNCRYNNFLMLEADAVLVNYIRANVNIQMQDLYGFMLKCMEKNNWNVRLAENILNSYDKINRISDDEFEILKVMFRYPEKFWKVVNSYINSNKSWTSEKNREKLNKLSAQEESRENFIYELQRM